VLEKKNGRGRISKKIMEESKGKRKGLRRQRRETRRGREQSGELGKEEEKIRPLEGRAIKKD